MNGSDVIRRLHQHRRWVNQRLLQTAMSLTEDELLRPFAIGQGSVWRTLTHLMAAEFVWLEALQGNHEPLMPGDLPGKLPGNQEGHGAMTTMDDLASAWKRLDERWHDYLMNLSDESLEETVYKVSTSSGAVKRHGTRCGDVLLHLCTHAQYTTAQLINMFRQLNLKSLPDVMLISMARQEQATTSKP